MDMGGVMNSCNEMNSGAEVNNAAQILEGIFLSKVALIGNNGLYSLNCWKMAK